MSRSSWKGPFIEKSLLTKVIKSQKKKALAVRCRSTTILPAFIDKNFMVYNGKQWSLLTVTDKMVGHKFGEFAPTRQFFGHTPADKKAKVEGGAKGTGK
jgi:small subunit ribosomal protein S19